MKKKILMLLLSLAMVFAFVACGDNDTPSETSEKNTQPPDLTGSWKQVNSNSEESYQIATIQGDVIEVYWFDEETDTKSLYWAGTYVAPETPDEPYTWDSENDKEQTSTALLASGDDTKTFTYDDGQISYEVTALGTTQTVKLEKTASESNTDSASENEEDEEEETVYGIGDTWTVDGQWELTVNSVEETQDRNEFSDKTPAAVYIVNYSYTNIGYEDDIMDGLYLSMEDTIVDAGGIMGYSYPGSITQYPQATPVGATCNAQACIGVDNAGDFKITVNTYDGESNKQTATFELSVGQ